MTVIDAGSAPDARKPWTARRIARILYEATVGAFRDLVWPDLRDGVIRVRDLRPAHTAVVLLASALLVGGIGVLVSGPAVRAAFDLVPESSGAIGRGSFVPQPIVPVTLLLLAFSTGLLLAGALHVRWFARVGVYLAYACFALAAQSIAFADVYTEAWKGWIALASVAGVGVVFVVRWKRSPNPVPEALVMIALTTVNFALVQHELFSIDRLSGANFLVDQTSTLVFLVAGIAGPLLLVAGLDVVEFGATASGWTLRFLDERVHRRLVLAALAALLAWRTRDLLIDVAGSLRDDFGLTWRVHVGALLLVALVGALWWAVDTLADRAAGDEMDDGDITGAARRIGLPMAIGYQTVALLMLFVILGVEVVGRFATGSRLDLYDSSYRFTAAVNDGSWLIWWRWTVDVVAIGGGLVLAARGRRAVGLVVAVIGMHDLLGQFMDRGNWLASILWDEASIDDIWFLVFASLTIFWAARRELTDERAERLLFLVLLGALIRQSDFLSDPFAVFFGFAGVGFVAFGLLWGFLTAGSWANESTPGFPRSSRVYVYLGYSLFSITLLDWFVLAHDVDQIRTVTDRTPSFGQYLLGFPMLYALFAVTIAGAIKRRPIEVG